MLTGHKPVIPVVILSAGMPVRPENYVASAASGASGYFVGYYSAKPECPTARIAKRGAFVVAAGAGGALLCAAICGICALPARKSIE